MAFGIHDIVNTVYGNGYITEVRPDCYVVRLTNWALAQGQSPTLYLQEESLTLLPNGALPGSTVSTVYGHAKLEKVRADNIHVAKTLNWKLANDTAVVAHLGPDSVTLAQTPGIEAGDEVITTYGVGKVVEKREKDVVVLLSNWALAQGQSPTLYLSPDSCVKIPGVKIGQYLKTVWGLVQIKDIRRDGTHVCEAAHWCLADGTAPTLYLAPEAFALLSIKP